MRKFAALFLVAALALVFAVQAVPARSDAAPLKLVAAHNQTSQENPYQYGMKKF